MHFNFIYFFFFYPNLCIKQNIFLLLLSQSLHFIELFFYFISILLWFENISFPLYLPYFIIIISIKCCKNLQNIILIFFINWKKIHFIPISYIFEENVIFILIIFPPEILPHLVKIFYIYLYFISILLINFEIIWQYFGRIIYKLFYSNLLYICKNVYFSLIIFPPEILPHLVKIFYIYLYFISILLINFEIIWQNAGL